MLPSIMICFGNRVSSKSNKNGGKMYIIGFKFSKKNRTFRVRSNEILFKKYNIENGTARGRSASPLLFLININDINLLNRRVIYPSDDISVWIEQI